jgi:hypothetical protein
VIAESIYDYLNRLELGMPFRTRVETLVPAFEFLSKETVSRVFIAEFDPDNDVDKRRWDSLWGFSDNFWYRAKAFLRDDFDVDASPLTNSVSYMGVWCSGFTFEDGMPVGISETSRMSMEVETGDHIYNPVAASGINCGELCDVISEFLAPNLRRGSAPPALSESITT